MIRLATHAWGLLPLLLALACGDQAAEPGEDDVPAAPPPLATTPAGTGAASTSGADAPFATAGAPAPLPTEPEPPVAPEPAPMAVEPAPTPVDGEPAMPVEGEPCGGGWGEAPIPASVDLGLSGSPEVLGLPGGSPDEVAIFDQINAEREAAGLAPLIFSEQVSNVARSHAADMNQLDYFDHGSSTRVYRDDAGNVIRDNWLPLPRLEFVYPGHFRSAGENIARYPDPTRRVVPAWMGSPGHRAAILDEYGWTATHGGVGMDGNTVVFSPARCR